MDKIRTLHIYTHEERHGKKEPLKPHPHHAKKKHKEEEEGEEGEEHKERGEVIETHEEAEETEEGSETEEKEEEEEKGRGKGKDSEATKKQKQQKAQNDEDEIVAMDTEAALAKFKTTEAGLPEGELQARRQKYGKNAIEDHKRNPFVQYMSYFANPLAYAMEIAALISAIVFDWLDFGLIIGLLFANATIGYWEEARAGTAIDALKQQLALKAWCRRGGGDWVEVESEGLVPGDIVSLRSGSVVPADCKLIGESEIKVDQSVLTGESLPVTKQMGAAVYSGSTVKQGESEALVYATGKNTYFGRSADLVTGTNTEAHYKKLLTAFGWFCSVTIILFVVLEIISQFVIRGKKCGSFGHQSFCPTINNLVVLIAGGVPIAMPTVLSVTMAIGASKLAKKGAICSRLTAVEDLAAMDVLCTDKTGTLTKNQLEMGEPYVVGKCPPEQLILDACLCSDFDSETLDPIDKAILEYHDNPDEIKEYKIVDFIPFDPTSKRTLAKVQSNNGESFRVAKGAPQIILDKATNNKEIAQEIEAKINEFAESGYRTIGVGRATGDGDDESWEMEGLIPLFDPPRDDTRDTIQKAMSLGITVKMLTGDQQAIALETAKRLGMGTRIMTAKHFDGENEDEFSRDIVTHDGFSQVHPEHKFHIVQSLQNHRHVVAMTGDGVNDAPALKKANVGFAVAGATEAARSASDIVMTEPGLSVMVDAIRQSRKIFERMKDYSTYTMSVTVRVVLTFSILTFAYDWYFAPVLVLIIAILNDGTIMTISRDRVKPAPLPDKWNFREIFLMAFLLGLWQVISTVVLFVIIKETNFFTDKIGLHPLNNNQLRGFIYLQVSVSGQATIFVTRTRKWSFLDRPAYLVLFAFITAQIIATFIGVYGLHGYPHDDGIENVTGCGWLWAITAWIWVIIWHPWMDIIKFFCNSVLFKMNIPLLHPYSEADKKRDELLEKKSKNAFKTDDSDNYSAIDVPNQDDDDLMAQEEEDTEMTQREHVEEHGESPDPSEKVAKNENEENKEEKGEEEHETREEETGEGKKVVEEHKEETGGEEGGEKKVTHEHTDKGDRVEHKVVKEEKDEEGEKVKEEVHKGEDEKGEQNTPAPGSPSL
eukprot:Phypoly_transcript_00852.p1 GENE.Phypoly_transcript_00852~~Phypoly_transcript_00852.p1  ORF type:complete len:1188 (+),score=342.28 Phypoly_transcript_00852:248-3565(+)